MNLPSHLLDILCCPVSHQPLRPLDKSRLKALNQRIRDGGVVYVDHSSITEPVSAGLITRDDKVIYAIEDDIPVLLPDRGIALAQFTDPL